MFPFNSEMLRVCLHITIGLITLLLGDFWLGQNTLHQLQGVQWLVYYAVAVRCGMVAYHRQKHFFPSPGPVFILPWDLTTHLTHRNSKTLSFIFDTDSQWPNQKSPNNNVTRQVVMWRYTRSIFEINGNIYQWSTN